LALVAAAVPASLQDWEVVVPAAAKAWRLHLDLVHLGLVRLDSAEGAQAEG